MRKILCAVFLVVCFAGEAFPASNRADAFMSLTFGLKWEF